MQDSRLSTVCTTATTPSSSATNLDTDGTHIGDTNYVPSITMIDKRDNQEYTIRKLADGNCWMTENLRYGINLDNTPHPWNSTTDPSLTDTNANTTKMADLTTSQICTTNSDCKNPNGSDVTAFSSGAINYTRPYIGIFDANAIDTVDNTGTKYGVLYNYCAASGGIVCTSSAQADTIGSICPKGWKMPGMSGTTTGLDSLPYSPTETDGSVDTLDNLVSLYNAGGEGASYYQNAVARPLSFLRSGYFLDGTLHRGGSNGGVWWSTKALSNYAQFDLALYGGATRRSGNSKFYAFAIRCVLAP